MPGGGIEIPCIYLLYVAKIHTSIIWEKIKKCERDLMIFKKQVFILLNKNPIDINIFFIVDCISWWDYTRKVNGITERDELVRG